VNGYLVVEELSAALTWNRIVTDGRPGELWGNPQATLADLNLELWSATSFGLDAPLDSSESTVDNVEHIFYENLTAGQYALRMPEVASGTDFALAWFSTEPVPEPTSLVLLLAGVIAVLGSRRQRSCR